MGTSRNRREYWNSQYVSYWKSRVEESEKGGGKSRIISGDAKSEDNSVYQTIFNQHSFIPGNILDVGCAWGRMFHLFDKYSLDIFGVDISGEMIREAKNSPLYGKSVKCLTEAEAEKIPFDRNFFDNVACIATFDATFQHKALSEFLRLLKIGGRLYLTGKNTNYVESDQLALSAEAGARKKGHPNFFTDYSLLLEQLKERKHKEVASYYFRCRGDFGKFKFESEKPDKFYEWLLVLEKGSEQIEFGEFSESVSKTFRLVKQSREIE